MDTHKELFADDLKRIIALQHREIQVKNERLKGVEELTRVCSELGEKRQSWQTKADNYETALRRAEARIAYLNKKLGIVPQTTFGIDVFNPGISRKDFDAITKENIRLKEALEHIVPTELGGKDVVVKNRELYELVTTLRDDLAQYEHHIKELESILASKEDDLAAKVNQLTKQNMKLGRSMQAKQVFSEKLLKENKRLNEIVDQQKGLVVVSQDVPDGQAIEDKMNVNENATTSAANVISNEEREKFLKLIEEKEKAMLEQTAKIQEMLTKHENLTKQITELTAEVAKANEGKQKIESELRETTKRCSDFQKKCAGFFNQVVSLNSKQQESEEENSSFKRACENLRAQLAEKEAMNVMMRDSLKTYENDFRRGNEEKAGIQKRVETAQQESERLRRENQSHMARIRHFESEIERMSKLLNDEKNRHKTTTSFRTGFGQPFGSSASTSKIQDQQKKRPGFFNQVSSLNSKRQGSEEEISSLKRACENLRAQLAEKEAMMVMMRDSLKTYEDELRRVNEERERIERENARLRRENQAHVENIRRLQDGALQPIVVADGAGGVNYYIYDYQDFVARSLD